MPDTTEFNHGEHEGHGENDIDAGFNPKTSVFSVSSVVNCKVQPVERP